MVVSLADVARLAPQALQVAADSIRPPERISPSDFAAKYRYLAPESTEKPGRWDRDYFPHLDPVMDAVEEAKSSAQYEGCVLMKAAQGGGSEAMINTLAWARATFDGPLLYLISKDDVAKEFGRERFPYLDSHCEPLARQAIKGYGSGETANVKRYTRGKVAIYGGKSVLNFESNPYLIVWVDEIDSLPVAVKGKGDLIRNVQARGKAFRKSPPLVVAFAHPTEKEAGAGRLFYKLSDQRRGFVDCPHCGDGSFWLDFDTHVQVLPEEGEPFDVAERNPERYAFVTPCCGAVLSDGDRWRAIRAGVTYRSTLSPEEAAKRKWLGIHFSALYYPHITLRAVVDEYVEGLDDEEVMRAFRNKTLGDTFEVSAQETSADDWSSLIWVPRREGDPNAYSLGEVPPRVSFLTAGQDSRTTELHWAVWGWGHVRNVKGFPELVGWLVDAGLVERDYSETIAAADLFPFDGLFYKRAWPGSADDRKLYLQRAYHDSGWCPVAVYEYCQRHRKAIPAKGAAEDSASSAPPHRWGAPPTWRNADDEEITDPTLKLALLNTYKLKVQLYGSVTRRIDTPDGPHPYLVLPREQPPGFLAQSASEYKTRDQTGRKWIWKHRGPNHWADCNLLAYAAALQLAPFLLGETADEARIRKQAQRQQQRKASRRRASGAKRGKIRRSYG